ICTGNSRNINEVKVNGVGVDVETTLPYSLYVIETSFNNIFEPTITDKTNAIKLMPQLQQLQQIPMSLKTNEFQFIFKFPKNVLYFEISEYKYTNVIAGSSYYTRENPLPGPVSLLLIGNILDRGFDDLVGYTERMRKKALQTPSFSKSFVIWTQNLVEEMMGLWEDGSDKNGCFDTELVEWNTYFNELLAGQNRKPKKTFKNDLHDASKFFNSIKTLINRDWLFSFVDEIIRQRRKEIEYTLRNESLRFDMLTSIITDRDICEIKMVDEEHTQPMNDEIIRGVLWKHLSLELIRYTANMFTIIVYYLAYHPDVLKRLRVELNAFFKKMGDRRLDLESLSDLVYTDAIIEESSI
ncbi:4082_t:CDS:2, partial [Funneliformis geosporum]